MAWRPGAAALEVWADDPIFAAEKGGGLDGIAFGGDGNLYFNNYDSGDLYRVNVGEDGTAGKATKLALARPLVFPDGMRSLGGIDFVLAEGGGRIDRITVNGDRVEIRALAEGIPGVSGIDIYGKSAWYIHGQLSLLVDPDQQGKAPNLPFNLMPVSLGK